MAEFSSDKADKEVVSTNSALGVQPKPRLSDSLLKYYIHDSTAECRLQLLGDLREVDIAELSGCWRTAKTTLGNRRLILDVRALKSADEVGKQWLAGMAGEGATYLPASYLRDSMSTPSSPGKETVRLGFFSRIFAVFRGSRVIPAQSSTQAQ